MRNAASFIVFNAGSQLSAATAGDADVIGRAATTTLIGIAAGGVATLLLGRSLDGIYDLTALCNGMLSGAVAMCSGTCRCTFGDYHLQRTHYYASCLSCRLPRHGGVDCTPNWLGGWCGVPL